MKYSDIFYAAKYTLGLLTPDDVVEFADQKLFDGFYSDYYLNIIDTKIRIWGELFPLFLSSLKELNINIPSNDDAALILIEGYLMEILAWKVDPYTQFNRLLHDLNFGVYKAGLGVDNIYLAFIDEIPLPNGTFDMKAMNLNIIEQCKVWAKVNGKEY